MPNKIMVLKVECWHVLNYDISRYKVWVKPQLSVQIFCPRVVSDDTQIFSREESNGS